jgi:hypothetical protein
MTFFQDALSNFTHDAASGGAIAHLAELGYTPQEIKEMLDFPTPYERVQESYWKYLLENQIIVENSSELGRRKERVRFVTDHDSYGRTSFRKVVEQEKGENLVTDTAAFQKITYTPGIYGAFPSFLNGYCTKEAYVSCDFGLRNYEFPDALTEKQRQYMEGVPWKRKVVWHLLNQRMKEILAVLQEQSSYHGSILLLQKREEIMF